jgi:alpha-N-arabinofuranosidase
LSRGKASVTEVSIMVEDQPLGTISRRLYGHFAEHLGQYCYRRLRVGTGPGLVLYVEGFRTDIVAALRDLIATHEARRD